MQSGSCTHHRFYFAHQTLSTFDGRCARELGYRVGTSSDVGGHLVEYAPSEDVTRLNYRGPLDP